jgi:hypothetical protein
MVTIANRRGLEQGACECFQTVMAELDALFQRR